MLYSFSVHRNFLTRYFLTRLFLSLGHHNYGLETRTLLVELVRKGIGLFILALLTSFLISAGVHYLQVCLRILISLLEISDLSSCRPWLIVFQFIFDCISEVSLDLVVRTRWWKFHFHPSLHQWSYNHNTMDNLDISTIYQLSHHWNNFSSG